MIKILLLLTFIYPDDYFDIKFLNIKSADVRLSINDTIYYNTPAKKIIFEASSSKLVKYIFNVENYYETITSKNMKNILYFNKKTSQPNLDNILTARKIGNYIKYEGTETLIPKNTFNIFSLLYFISYNRIDSIRTFNLEREGLFYQATIKPELSIDNNIVTYELELIIKDLYNKKIPVIKNTDIFTWALFKKNAQKYITIDYSENKIIGCHFKNDLPENDAESDQLRWVASLFALKGPLRKFEVDEMLQLTPGGRRLEDLVSRFPMLMAWPSKQPRIDNAVDRRGLLGDVARLRLSGRSDDALERIKDVQTMMPDMLGARWFVAEALCLIDLGKIAEAMEIHYELSKFESDDPYVAGLCEVLITLGQEAPHLINRRMEGLIEVSIATESKKMSRLEWSRLIDSMPTNAVAALKLGRKGEDEALASNAWISMGPALKKNMWPVVRGSFVVTNALFICMILAGLLIIYMEGPLGIPLVIGAIGLWARAGNLRQVVRHRDMPLCKDYCSRLRSRRAMVKYKDLPVGTHLMLSGIVVPIADIPLDLGYPLWVDPLVGKRDKWLPGLNLGKGSDKKRKKRLKENLDGESSGFEGRGVVSKTALLSRIDKKNQQKRERYDGIRNMSSSVVQARGDSVVFDTEEHNERTGGPRRPSARGPPRKRNTPPGFKGPGNRDSVFY